MRATSTTPKLSAAPVVPTDRVALDRLSEEDQPIESLISEAYANNPQIEQAVLNMRNNKITIKAEKNGLLPVLDAFAFYGATGLGGAQSPGAIDFDTGEPYAPGTFPSIGYGTAVGNLFNSSSPNKGVGVNLTVPLRNRTAQADQARSQMELRQSEMRLQQLYTQIRIQIINSRYALTNDRAQVDAAQAQHDYAQQSLIAEQKKYKLGASTSALVLQQGRTLAIAENSLISATARLRQGSRRAPPTPGHHPSIATTSTSPKQPPDPSPRLPPSRASQHPSHKPHPSPLPTRRHPPPN